MALSINTNIAATNAYRNLSTTQNSLSSSLEKLSSGFRINRAADDAAGLAISEGLRSQVGGLTVAVRNAQDGISVVQTAEGALTESHAILQRMRDLSVQASNTGGLSTDAKKNIQLEIGELKQELTRIAETTQFNGTKLLDSTYDGKFQIGANVGEAINVKVGTAMSDAGLGVDGVDVTLAVATDALAGVETTAAAASTAGVTTIGTADMGVAESFELLNGTITVGGKSLDLSTVKYEAGADPAARLTAVNDALDKAGVAATASSSAAGLVITGDITPGAAATGEEIAAAAVNFTQASGADGAILKIDDAIATVSTVRAELGAKQNRLDHTINSLNVSIENLTASESRIRDTDMAQEMVNFTKNQILSQAGTAMLAQANQIPQGILQLLR
ncbi:MAG: flagellin N-terminal helical domain-containing protein [Georgenia sp.]